MKRQYLGDSKDSFKWNYLHALVDALGYDRLRIAWLWTPDDHGPDGRTDPERFPARLKSDLSHTKTQSRKGFPGRFSVPPRLCVSTPSPPFPIL